MVGVGANVRENGKQADDLFCYLRAGMRMIADGETGGVYPSATPFTAIFPGVSMWQGQP